MSFLQRLIDAISRLLSGGDRQPEQPEPDTPTATCQLGQVEIPADQPDVPFIATAQDALDAFGGDQTGTSANAICTCTIRAEYSLVNIRLGPGLDFDPVATTRGGTQFDLVGTAEADDAGFRWFAVQIGRRSGWIRADLLQLAPDCSDHSDIGEDDVSPPPPPPPPESRFSPPARATVTQGFNTLHPGYDLGTVSGTPILAPTQGTVIRRVTCPNCEGEQTSIFPCPPSVFRDPDWGYGYGNFLIVRFDYNRLPAALRAYMDENNLRDGFAYVLYAHFSRLDVSLGQRVEAGKSLGATGHHGCSSAEHLHFEVRIGNVETVNGRWLQQTAVNPNLMFDL